MVWNTCHRLASTRRGKPFTWELNRLNRLIRGCRWPGWIHVECCHEPLNIKRDYPGYSLPRFEDAVRLSEQVGSPGGIRILMEIYHTQIQEGNIVEAIRNHHDMIGCIHVADVPG